MGEPNQPVLITAIIVLGGVIAYLFKLYVDHQKETTAERNAELRETRAEKDRMATALASERGAWATKELRIVADHETEINELKIEYETKHKEQLQQLSHAIETLRTHYQDREDVLRKEFADTVDAMSAHAERGTQAVVEVLDKIYDRFMGPRPRTRKGV